ncbi:MAG: AmmeMemoRadiSam system protein A, partial [Thiohalobacterales bacterium]|nr:AmmeMemoRadiSam system protein A [Thiohalobacterales bacterium]
MLFTDSQQQELLDIARESIQEGLQRGQPLTVEVDPDSPLASPGASFVTLKLDGQLRGCIGSLEAYRPLIRDVAENAYAAAFQDPRFSPLTYPELDRLDLSLSILTPAERMTFTSQEDLLGQLQPGIDGLILQEDSRRGTFLPSVWESLPQANRFLSHLKLKAGLP